MFHQLHLEHLQKKLTHHLYHYLESHLNENHYLYLSNNLSIYLVCTLEHHFHSVGSEKVRIENSYLETKMKKLLAFFHQSQNLLCIGYGVLKCIICLSWEHSFNKNVIYLLDLLGTTQLIFKLVFNLSNRTLVVQKKWARAFCGSVG